MNYEDLTIKQVKDITKLFGGNAERTCAVEHPYEIGKVYLIRTVTMMDTGRLVAVTDQELVLEDAAWIADSGRFSDALEKCDFNEVEPFPNGRVIIGRGAIIDAVVIKEVQRIKK